jgi:hypothetical protein
MLGLVPFIFEKCNLNLHIHKNFYKKKSLFTQSLFSYNPQREDDFPKYLKNKDLYSKTILVGGVEAKGSLENLEFIMGKQTLTDNHIMSKKSDPSDSLINL